MSVELGPAEGPTELKSPYHWADQLSNAEEDGRLLENDGLALKVGAGEATTGLARVEEPGVDDQATGVALLSTQE